MIKRGHRCLNYMISNHENAKTAHCRSSVNADFFDLQSGQPSPPKKGGVNAPLLKYTFEVTQRFLYIDVTLLHKNKWVWGQGCEWGAGFVPFPCQIS